MAQSFTDAQWTKIHDFMGDHAEDFGMPVRRDDSVVLCSFNIRKLGAVAKKSDGAWRMLERICERCDLVAVQEVMDDLNGLRHLKEMLGDKWGMVASDITGGTATERLAFLFRWDRVERTEVASDITYDRSAVLDTLYGSRFKFWESFDDYTVAKSFWDGETPERKEQGKDPKEKPVVHLPAFLTFIRQPLCVSFRVPGAAGAEPYEFLAVNAHLLYGKYKDERQFEFEALVGWLIDRAKRAKNMYHKNIILLGDLNLDFVAVDDRREEIEAFLKARNSEDLSSDDAAELNFPFLDVHPGMAEVFRSNARENQTYDQIALAIHDDRLPNHEANDTAGSTPGGFDFGMFNFVDVFANALHGVDREGLSSSDKKALYKKFEHDLSDHMPIWIRLPKPA